MIPSSTYQSYLVRFWRDNSQRTWHASLQSTTDTEKFVFAEINSLFEFLLEQLATNGDAPDHPDGIAADPTD